MSQLDLEPMDNAPKGVPLAELLRPQRLEDVLGQDKLIGLDGRLRRMLDSGELASIIFWGPPGTGKTTIARLLAGAAEMVFEPVSAVFDGVAELRKVFARAEERRQARRRHVGAAGGRAAGDGRVDAREPRRAPRGGGAAVGSRRWVTGGVEEVPGGRRRRPREPVAEVL